MKDLTTAESVYLVATSDLETEQDRYLRVLHCVLDRRLPDSGDLADAVLLSQAIDTIGMPALRPGFALLATLWRALLPIALVHYYSLEVAA